MTPHDHREYVPGCYRCELSRDEVEQVDLASPGDLLVIHIDSDDIEHAIALRQELEASPKLKDRGIDVLVLVGDAIRSFQVAKPGVPLEYAEAAER